MIIDNAENYKSEVVALLNAENLPTTDLPLLLENFIVAMQNEEVIGVAGLEVYGDYGLLRSLAIDKKFRNRGIAQKLLQMIESAAGSKGLKEIYLLTETAPDYFLKNGYEKITRADVPADVQQSSEFSHVCPVSAVVMKKFIIKQ